MGIKKTYLTWLSPFSWVLALRHFLYDRGIFTSWSFDVPVICVGNLAVGGTGKTPMTEFLVERLLEKGRNPIVLSRGYGRKTRGFRYVTLSDTASDVGDEPLQIKRRFCRAVVAVCEDRVRGVRRLLADHPQDPWIILDDAFQHRRIRAEKNILMTDCSRPFWKDTLLPLGRLRDLPSAVRRADCVVLTRCKPKMPFSGIIKPVADIPVFSTMMSYGDLIPLNDPEIMPEKGSSVLLLTGIAYASPLRDYLQTQYKVECHLEFSDHHRFTAKDLSRIKQLLGKHPNWHLITTAKDDARLTGSGIAGWVIPLRISFFSEESAAGFFHLVTGLR
ncbi:MAG TPA: tetraacyldisaccharide 4'-kinase [Bacteroidales bacterium]|nr:MAG: Tetraacyldisaccharide 4'-kinase [Bacteroidetes bacterium ADurb.Bin037]HPV88236.1 tetraacyldisaccharide 4'-kinase [Bacteroidales bacterium]HPW78279.1 tetraacyldisaccharide 4'-kinase [Bacteroidales bacterium]HQB56118.1 tetraacyldisaccharide 4'-kinase [Bacteroidales bacterium]